MRPITLLYLAVGLSAVGFGLAIAAAPADATPTPDTNDTDDDPDDLQTYEGFEQRLDSEVVINEFSYSESGEFFEIQFTVNSSPTNIAFTEVISQDDASTASMNVLEERFFPGEHEIRFSADPGANQEAQVVISTEEAMEQGQVVVVSSGDISENPFRHFGGESGLLSGLAFATLTAFAAGLYVVRREDSGVIEAKP